jgi:hypothetical protein
MRIKHYILDKDYNVITTDFKTWAKWMGDINNRRVAHDTFPDQGYDVSTVFLGLDHRWGWQGGPPILFETMVFRLIAKTEYRGADVHMERHCTWGEAEKYHRKICERMEKGIFQEDYFHQEDEDFMKERLEEFKRKQNGTK